VGDSRGSGRRPGAVRRLYDWVLGWAETRFGMPALAALAFVESSFFIIPPDPLLIALALGRSRRALTYAAVATLASVAGGVMGYWIGAQLWDALGPFFFEHVAGVDEHSFERVRALYDRWSFGAVIFAGLTPIPYKVFTIAAGVFAIDLPTFVAASLVGRGMRFFAVAILIFHFGQPIKAFIDRYFVPLSWALGIILVAGFAAIRLI